MESFLLLKMRVIIFNDKNNFDGSLNLINRALGKGRKRFWRVENCHSYLFRKLGEVFSWKPEELKLIRSYIYTGQYNSKILKKHKKYCKKEMQQIDRIIERENNLFKEIDKNPDMGEIKEKLKEHVNSIKGIFCKRKEQLIRNIKKQKRNFDGQRRFFEKIEQIPFIEYRVTPLKHANGIIYQKGVDVKLAADLIHLANVNAYDIALLLGGDTDLIESVKLVKDGLGKIIVLVAYYDESNPKNCSISKEFIKCADFFINLKNFENKEIEEMSELRRVKELED